MPRHGRRRVSVLFLCSSLGLACATPGPAPLAAAAPPLPAPEAPPPAPAPGRPAAASEGVPEVVLLLDEVTFRLDAEGRVDTHWHQRFRIDAESAIDEWASLEAGWGPWYEARPELQAEVLLPDGKKLTLDPKTIDVAATPERDATMYRDRRMVRAPLPGVRVGAIVDERIVRREERPFFAGGTFRRFGLGAGVPVERSRLVVDVPEGLPLRFQVHGATLEPKEERRDGRRILTFEGGPYAPLTLPEPSSPATPAD